jgi:hypothetical protein
MYEIDREDLLGTFPYAKVLQACYGSIDPFLAIKPKVKGIQSRFKRGKLSLEDCRVLIAIEVSRVRGMFPEDFPEGEGWWDKRVRVKPESIVRVETEENRIRLIRINTIRKYIVDNKLDTFSIGDLKPLKSILKINLTRWMLESLLGESLQVCKGKGNRYRMKGVEEMGMLRGKDRDFCPPAETT